MPLKQTKPHKTKNQTKTTQKQRKTNNQAKESSLQLVMQINVLISL